MQPIYEDSLRQAGLSEKESRVYAHMLRNGAQPASAIAKQTGISRTNVYHLLQQLEIKGLITKDTTGSKVHFVCEHPKSIDRYLLAEEQRLRLARSRIDATMSDLIADFALASHRAGVFRFEGKEGLVRAYDELLKDRLDVNSIMDREQLREFIADYNPEYVRKRIRYKIRSRIITPGTTRIPSNDTVERREVRFLNPKLFPFHMDLKVTAQKVVLTTFKRTSCVGIIIADEEIATNFLTLFNFLWQIAEG